MAARRAPAFILLVGGMLLLSGVAYLAAYLSLPSDGTVIEVGAVPAQPGLVVDVYRPDSTLQTGDLVIAINGQPLDAWMVQALRRPVQPAPPAAALDYTVLRADETLTVRQALLPPSPTTLLRRNWSTFLFLVYWQVISAVVFTLRPWLPVARLLLVFTTTIFASSLMYFLGLPVSALQHGWLVWLWLFGVIVLYGILAGNAVLFTIVFPRVWPALRQRPSWTILIYAGVWLPWLAFMAWGWPRVAGSSAHLLLALRATNTLSVVVFPLAVVASFISYRLTQSEADRRQVRWILWGVIMAVLPWVLFAALPQALGLPAILPTLVIGLLWCTLPTAFAISILREGLFDIDVIINRSLVYGGLTVVLALAYFGSVIVFQSLLRAFTGQQQSQLATVLSTLGIAALFSPARQGLQRAVDRRFYRRKYDAARTLAAFGATLRDEVDLSVLNQRLVGVVHDTMEPAQAWLWLRPAPGSRSEPRARGIDTP